MHLLLVVVVWASIGASLTTANTMEEYDSEVDRETERIIGGSDATTGQFPYAAALHYMDRNDKAQFICTASILSSTTVMAAAHCVILNGELQPANSFYLIANVSRMARTVRIDVANVIHHPDYNGSSIDSSIDNDIAILKTVEAIEFGDHVGPVCIAGPETKKLQYRNATAIGWGNMSRIRFLVIRPRTLQHVEQMIVTFNHCSFLSPDVKQDKICARGFFTGICNGDSGGPLVHLSTDKPPVVIGIASYINALVGCGKISPAVWTRVSSHYDFIMQAAQDDSICVV